MDEEEAILQMNMLGHSFFIFTDAESDETNIVYKRKDGKYGLIETINRRIPCNPPSVSALGGFFCEKLRILKLYLYKNNLLVHLHRAFCSVKMKSEQNEDVT